MSDKSDIIKRKRGILIVISGPSGTGKNTVLDSLYDKVPDLTYSISATTRAPRVGEIDKTHYFFMSRDEFVRDVELGKFIETAEFCGNLYGTPKDFIEHNLSNAHDVIMDIEIKGAKQVKEAFEDAVMIFLLPPSIEVLEHRLVSRGKDTKEEIYKRIQVAKEEAKFVSNYDYIVINDNLDETVNEIASIICAERSKISRRSFDTYFKKMNEYVPKG